MFFYYFNVLIVLVRLSFDVSVITFSKLSVLCGCTFFFCSVFLNEWIFFVCILIHCESKRSNLFGGVVFEILKVSVWLIVVLFFRYMMIKSFVQNFSFINIDQSSIIKVLLIFSQFFTWISQYGFIPFSNFLFFWFSFLKVIVYPYYW